MASDPLLRPAGRLAAVPVDALSGCSELLGARRRTPWWGGKDHGPTVRGVSPGPCRPNGQARIGFSSTSLGEAHQWLTSSCDPSGRWCQPVRQGQPSGLRSVVLPDGDEPTDPRRPRACSTSDDVGGRALQGEGQWAPRQGRHGECGRSLSIRTQVEGARLLLLASDRLVVRDFAKQPFRGRSRDQPRRAHFGFHG